MARRIGLTCLAIVVAAAAVAATQAPAPPRLNGEAPPLASPLSLWYRAPAAEHPLVPAGASRMERQLRVQRGETLRTFSPGRGTLPTLTGEDLRQVQR